MPVKNCQLEGQPGYKWGDQGKCYTYDPSSDSSKRRARQKAINQGLAIGVDYKNQKFQSYNDYPQAASQNAERAIRLRDDYGLDCGTAVGWARANQLAKRENISRDTIARMASFERHRSNSAGDPKEDCGALMWLAWGGDEGIEWAQRKLEQIDNQEFAGTKISFDFDDTLTESKWQEKAAELITNGEIVYIVTARRKDQSEKVFKIADELGIPRDRVHFTEGADKWKELLRLGIQIHYDNNQEQIDKIKANTQIEAIKV